MQRGGAGGVSTVPSKAVVQSQSGLQLGPPLPFPSRCAIPTPIQWLQFGHLQPFASDCLERLPGTVAMRGVGQVGNWKGCPDYFPSSDDGRQYGRYETNR